MGETELCSKDDLRSWLTTILKKHNIENFDFEILGVSEKGDNYMGEVAFVKVRRKDDDCGNDEAKELDLVVKYGKKDKHLREKAPMREAYENEILVYTEIMPLFLQFQQEHNIEKPFNHLAKCYGTLLLENTEVLALENLKSRNFCVLDRRQPMNLQQIKSVIELYGKFHAISLALRFQKPELFEKLSRKLWDVFGIWDKSYPKDENFHPFGDVMEYAAAKNEHEVVEKLKVLEKDLMKVSDLTDPDDPHAVILHGDCWNNNFMFQFKDDSEEIADIRFLDWQISRLASPVFDLSYFLFTNLSAEHTKDFDRINGWYYESLSEHLSALGGNPEKLFPFEELQNHWKKYYQLGMVMLPGIMRICLSEKDEVRDMADVANTDNPDEVFIYKVKNFEEYGKRCLAIVKLVIEKGWL